MTTCRKIFTFSWPLRGRGGEDPSGQPDRFFPAFFFITSLRYKFFSDYWRTSWKQLWLIFSFESCQVAQYAKNVLLKWNVYIPQCDFRNIQIFPSLPFLNVLEMENHLDHLCKKWFLSSYNLAQVDVKLTLKVVYYKLFVCTCASPGWVISVCIPPE